MIDAKRVEELREWLTQNFGEFSRVQGHNCDCEDCRNTRAVLALLDEAEKPAPQPPEGTQGASVTREQMRSIVDLLHSDEEDERGLGWDMLRDLGVRIEGENQ